MPRPAVTLFLPTYARFADGYLERAISSALAQDFTNFELIVIDDGSLDGSEAYLRRVASQDPRVRYIRLARNLGLPALVLAEGWKHAQGERFAWLFDDCELRPDHLSTLSAALDNHPAWGMCYAKVEARLDAGHSFVIGSGFNRGELEVGGNFIPNVCVMIRRDVIDQVGWYDPHVLMKRLCDWDLWLRVAKRYEVGFVDRILATENGIGLAGSLGRTNELDHALVMKYAAIDRDHRLHPAALSVKDGVRREFECTLDVDETIRFEFGIFEHAFQVMDEVLLAGSLERLSSLGALDILVRRYLMQSEGSEPTDISRLMLGFSAYVRRRTAAASRALVEAETQARSALDVAEIRYARIIALQLEVRELRLQAMQADRCAAEARAELDNVRKALDMFRDAADQRLEMLNHANERVVFWNGLAEDRLRIIEEQKRVMSDQGHGTESQ